VLLTGLATGLGLMAAPSLAAQADPPQDSSGAVQRAVQVGGGTATAATRTGTDTEVREIAVPRVGAHRAQAAETPAPAAVGKPSVAGLQRRSTHGFSMLGLTWRRGTAPSDVAVQVRTHGDRGWSGWRELHFDPSEGPAPGEEPAAARDGTAPLWVGAADGVEASVHSAEGAAPADLELTLVDPGTDPAATASTVPAVLTGPSTATATTVATRRPRVVTRRQWGADPRLRSHCDSPRRANSVQMAFVHHTVGSNNYSRSDSPAIVRGIYAYHTQGQGWCDIGYNFLVDRFGRTFEGRAGGINTPVRGAHAGDYNVRTVGVSLMGNFEKTRPTRAMRRGVTRLLAWKLGSYYRYPRTKARIAGKRFEKISGHRDAMSTACPGRYVYSWLPTLRNRVANRAGRIETPISRRWQAMRRHGTNLGQPFRGEASSGKGGRKTQFNRGWVFWNERPGAHAVRGRIYQRYRRYGQASGKLGYPRTNAWHIRGHRGTGQTFQRGRIYRTRAYGARAVWGKVSRRYARAGLADGRLGVPVRNQYRIRRGWAGDFQHGRITWNTSTGRTTVRYH
jgi:hypothetical protein